MPIQTMADGSRRNVTRGGLLGRPRRPSPQAARRQALDQAKAKAEASLPVLNKLIDDLAKKLRTGKSKDRFFYNQVLCEIYHKAFEWKSEKKLEKRATQIASLRGKTLRKNSSAVGELVGAVSERAGGNSKTASRWAVQLNKALESNVKPEKIKKYLSGS